MNPAKEVMNMAKNAFQQLEVIKIAAKKGRRITDCFRLLYKEELWLKAFVNLGLPVSGTFRKDAVYLEEIRPTIENLRNGSFCRSFFTFPYKKNGVEKPFLKELLLLESMKFILEAVFEDRISSGNSTGEAKNPCDALMTIKRTFGAFTWCIQGEISPGVYNCRLVQMISARIDDRRFLYLLKKVLTSGILEHRMASSFRLLLERIYYSEMDQFVRTYSKSRFFIKEEDAFRKIQYVRFGREFVIGLSSTKQQARRLLADLENFLYEQLCINKNSSRVQLFHLEKRVPFLGYEFSRLKKRKGKCGKEKTKSMKAEEPVNRTAKKIILLIPDRKIIEFGQKMGYGVLGNDAIYHRKKLIHKSEEEILAHYNEELRKFALYYRMADNVRHLDKLFYLARASFIKTVAVKRKSTVAKTAEFLRKKGLRIISRRAVYFERSTYGSEGGKETCSLTGKAPCPTLRSDTEQRGYRCDEKAGRIRENSWHRTLGSCHYRRK